MNVKSFRGRLLGQNSGTLTPLKIRLSTPNGMTGYKINKFQAMPANPTNANNENLLQIWKEKGAAAQTASGNNDIDFNSPLLLAALYIENNAGDDNAFVKDTVIFDNEVINQDIYLTNEGTAQNINFYIELEQVKLSVDEATVATLKDMRGRE